MDEISHDRPAATGLMPRGEDELGNQVMFFGGRPLRAVFDRGPRPLLAPPDVLEVCGLPRSPARKRLDVGGMSMTHPFRTPGGPQGLRVVDLDDAYRIAHQGRSDECRAFRELVIAILKRIEGGRPFDDAAVVANPAAGAGDAPLAELRRQSAYMRDQAKTSRGVLHAIVGLSRRLDAAAARSDELTRRLDAVESRLSAGDGPRALPSPTAVVRAATPVDAVPQLIREHCRRTGEWAADAWLRLYA